MRRVVVLLALAMLLAGCSRPADPLGLSSQGSAQGTVLRAGQTVAVTWTFVRNRTGHDVTLLGVRPLAYGDPIPDAPRLTGGYLLDPAEAPEIFGMARLGEDVTYPPEVLHPLDGFVLRAGEERHLLVMLEVSAPGRFSYDGVVVDYLYAGKVYSPLVGLDLVLCADQPADCLDLL